MSANAEPSRDIQFSREIVEELIRTGLALGQALASLIEDLPATAFPGEDAADVLLEMAAGTCTPVIQAAGETLCSEALGLVRAVREKFVADLKAAADRAASQHRDD
jgi:hypothetical protein